MNAIDLMIGSGFMAKIQDLSGFCAYGTLEAPLC